MSKEMIELQIPEGWELKWSNLVELGPLDELTDDERLIHLTQDLVWIKSEKPDGFQIDVGWYPDEDIEGGYKLLVHKGDWDDILIEYKTNDTRKIQQAIELCLEKLSAGVSTSEIQKELEKKQ